MPTNKELEKQLNETRELMTSMSESIKHMAEAVNEVISRQDQAEANYRRSAAIASDVEEDEGIDAEHEAKVAELIAKNQADPANQAIIKALQELVDKQDSNLYKRSKNPLQITQKYTPDNYSLKQATIDLCKENGWQIIPNSWHAVPDAQFMYRCYVTSPFTKGKMPVVSRWVYDEALDYWTPIIGVSPNPKVHIQNKAFAGSKQLNLKPGQRVQDMTAEEAMKQAGAVDMLGSAGVDPDADIRLPDSAFDADE